MNASAGDVGRDHVQLDPAERLVQITLVVLLTVAFVYVLPRWADWSQNSRLNLTLAIVDDGTLSIDRYYENTGDYALFEGKHYTDKAPGPSFLAVPVYVAVRPILHTAVAQRLIDRIARSAAFATTLRAEGTGLLKAKVYYAVVLYICTIFISALPSAVLGAMLYQLLRLFGLGIGWAAGVVVIYGLATTAFPYAGAFFSHQLTAALSFGAFYIGYLVRHGRIAPPWVMAAGLMLGFAVISEYPTALLALGVGLYMLSALRGQRRWTVAFVLSAVPPVLLLMAYNWAIFRTPLPVGYRYSERYTELHGEGLLSVTYPHAEAWWGITFGSFRGLFYVSPVLLLAAVGFWPWWRSGRMRAEWAVCVWATVGLLLFNGSSAMWQGGYSVGPRYVVAMLPFLTMGLGAFVLAWGDRRWARGLTWALAAWSFVVVWALTLAGQNYPDWTPAPLFNYALPRLLAGDVARNLGMAVNLRGWQSLLPLAAILAILVVLLVKAARSATRARSANVPRVGYGTPMPRLGKK
jgi:hypothetical protein